MDAFESNIGYGRTNETSNNEGDKYNVNEENVATVLLQLKESGDLTCLFEGRSDLSKIEQQKDHETICSFVNLFLEGQIIPILLVAIMKYYNMDGREKECVELINQITKLMYGGKEEMIEEPVISPIDAFMFRGTQQ
jgi:hypothetical protein